MIRRTAKWSIRLGVLAAVAFAIKRMVDAQKQEAPKPVRLVDVPAPPRPEPSSAPAQPAPRVAQPEMKEVVREPAPVATEPAPPKTAPSKAAPVKKAAKKANRPLKANRNGTAAKSPPKHVEPPPPQMVSWVEPLDGVCPTTHPIKVKLGSRVFRKPDMPSYENSKPDRCYASEGAARRAGFNEAQR